MWQLAVALGSALIGEHGKKKQMQENNKAIQRSMDSNFEAANRNIKDVEIEARRAAQKQQSDIVAQRIAAAEAKSAAEINSGVEGQSIDLYNNRVERQLENQLGNAAFNFELFNEDIVKQANQIAYNTNIQNEALKSGASQYTGFDAISSALNLASAYQSGLNAQKDFELLKMQNDKRLL